MTAVIPVDQALDLRRGVIGASQAAAAIGLDPFRTPVRLFLELTGRAEWQPNEAAEWGKILEPIVRGYYVERHQCEVHVPAESLYHAKFPWLRATPDGIRLRDGKWGRGVEIKCVGLRMADHWLDGDEVTVPVWYHVQAQTQMSVLRSLGYDITETDFPVLIGGQRYVEQTIQHDDALEAEIIDGLNVFKWLLDTDTMPPVDGSDDYRKILLGRTADAEMATNDHLEQLSGRLREIAIAQKQLKAEESLTRNRIIAELAAHKANKVRTSLGWLKVSAPGAERDWKALATDYATQLQLRGVPANLDEDVKRFTTTEASGSLRRPKNWTKES